MSPSNGTILDHFNNEQDFCDMLEEAEDRTGHRSQEFLEQLREKYERHGAKTFLSEAQYQFLCNLAGVKP